MRQAGDLGAPGRSAERSKKHGALLIVEHEEVDLVRVLVLDDSPGEGARVQEIRIEPQLTRDRV